MVDEKLDFIAFNTPDTGMNLISELIICDFVIDVQLHINDMSVSHVTKSFPTINVARPFRYIVNVAACSDT